MTNNCRLQTICTALGHTTYYNYSLHERAFIRLTLCAWFIPNSCYSTLFHHFHSNFRTISPCVTYSSGSQIWYVAIRALPLGTVAVKSDTLQYARWLSAHVYSNDSRPIASSVEHRCSLLLINSSELKSTTKNVTKATVGLIGSGLRNACCCNRTILL